jgi:hypothetical protein
MQNSKFRILNSEFESACSVVSERAAKTLQWVTGKLGLHNEALDHLTLGRAALYASVLESRGRRSGSEQTSPTSPVGLFAEEQRGLASAATQLDAAVAGLRRASAQHYLPRGLLTRAWSSFAKATEDRCSVVKAEDHRLRNQQKQAGDYETSAQGDLDEAWEIAERGPMPLFLADIHLYRARLFHAVTPYPWATDPDGHSRGPHDDLAEARRLIEKHGYWRRKQELEDAEAAARDWPRSTR